MTPEQEIEKIKDETFARLRKARQVWIVEENGAEFVVHRWTSDDWQYGAGVGPQSSYPTLRKAAARLLQILGVGAVAPQTWPEKVCIGSVALEPQDGERT